MRSKESRTSHIAVGEVVLLQDEQVRNRAFWKLGLIEELITGKDNEVRGVRVRTGNRHIIERPVQKVFPLELKAVTDNSPIKEQTTTIERPTRAAKTVANERIAIVDQLEEELD